MSNLDNLRKQVDKVDEKILLLLGKRMSVARKIGQLKKEKSLPVLDKTRWNQVLRSNLVKSENLGLSKNFIREIFRIIHKNSLRVQKGIK